jgi:hypothetical protein
MSKNFEDTKWYSYTSSTETTRTWARRLRSYEEIPHEFQPAFPKDEDHFPYTLLIPEDRLSLFRKRNKKTLCVYEDRFLLLEALRNEIQTSSNMFTDVLYLERGKILLYSWLKIVTPSDTLMIRFNTTNEYLFDPVLEQVRQGMSNSHPHDAALNGNEQELSKFDYLIKVNFKYMNYGRKSIRPDDPVIGIVYEPERCIQEFRLFNRTLFRRYATDHLSILTEKELILIKEDKRVRIDKESKHGGVFTYIPRRQIRDVSFISDPRNSHCTMEITLSENTRLASEFSSANEELELLQSFLS